MSWSAGAAADGHIASDSSTSEKDVEVFHTVADAKRHEDVGVQKRLTLTFKHVTVNVTAPGETLGETLWSWANPSQLLSLFRSGNHTKRV